MRKYIISFIAFFMLLPSVAQTEVDGAWIAPSKPGWAFVLMDGINPSSMEESIGMAFLRPNQTTWEMYFGPKTGPDAAALFPWLSISNMKATWSSNTTDGTLRVDSCTSGDCPFNTGDTVAFEKVFGDGIDPRGELPDESNVCSREQCAVDPDAAQQCQSSLEACLEAAGDKDEDECIAAAILFCGAEE
jgi:hypothetical protein